MPPWFELALGALTAVAGIWKGGVELDKVDQAPEETRWDLRLAAEWRDARVTTGCLWAAVGIIPGIGLVAHSTGRMVFGW